MTNEINSSHINGELRLIIQKIDAICEDIKELKGNQSKQHETAQARLQVCEKNQALLQQSVSLITNQVSKQDERLDKNDLLTKILGAITTFLVALGTALVAYFASVWQHFK